MVVFAARPVPMFNLLMLPSSPSPDRRNSGTRVTRHTPRLVISALDHRTADHCCTYGSLGGTAGAKLGPASASAYRVCGFAGSARFGFALISDPLDFSLAVQRLGRHQVYNRTRGSDSPDHCRPDGRAVQDGFNLAQGIVGTASPALALQLSTTLSGLVRTERLGSERGVFVYRRHRVSLANIVMIWFLMPETRPPTERATETDGQSSRSPLHTSKE